MPMGFEEERVALPLISEGAEKVYFLVQEEGDEARSHLNKIYEKLEKEAKNIETKEEKTDIFDYLRLMSTMNRIVKEETKKGNHLFVNISSGSSISAVAGAYIGAIHEDVTPYYVKVEEYADKREVECPNCKKKVKIEGPLSKGVTDVQEIQTYRMNPPPEEFIIVLKIIKDSEPRIGGEHEIRLKQLIEQMKKANLLHGEIWDKEPEEREGRSYRGIIKPNVIHSVREKLLKKMVNEGYIDKEKRGRDTWIGITPKGERTLKMFESTLDV